jgi:hypothetical protein
MKSKKDCSEKELEDLYIEPALINVGSGQTHENSS